MKTPCPICYSDDFEKVFDCTDHFVSGELFAIIECKKCGMRITADFPSEENIGKYYEAIDYISHSDTKKGFVNSLYHYVRQYMLRKKARWVEKSSGILVGDILDVGAGTGYFANTIKQRGWNVAIVEQNEVARDFAEKHFALSASPNIAVYESKTSEKVDVVSLWHVLEHIEDLNEAIKMFDKILKKEGTLIIAVPNCNSYDARKYKKLWAAYDVPRHLWHFRAEQMSILAKNNGFSIYSIKTMPFDAFYISIMSEKNAKHSFHILRGVFSGLVGTIFSILDKKKCSSLVYIMKKNN